MSQAGGANREQKEPMQKRIASTLPVRICGEEPKISIAGEEPKISIASDWQTRIDTFALIFKLNLTGFNRIDELKAVLDGFEKQRMTDCWVTVGCHQATFLSILLHLYYLVYLFQVFSVVCLRALSTSKSWMATPSRSCFMGC